MKICILGAAGQTGRLLVQQARARGHDVTAFVRDPQKLPAQDGVHVVQGDALDEDAVARAVAGHDAVVHAIGSGDMKPSTLRTRTAATTVRAMQKAGVRRLVAMSGLGAGETRKNMGFVVDKIIAPLILKNLLADQNGLEDAIRPSTLEWTLVRPGELKDAPGKGKVTTSLDGRGLSMGLPRADVAAFILDEIERPRFVRQAPGLGS